MATIRGTEFRLYINTGSIGAPVYTRISGEGDLTLSIASTTVETTTKDDTPWDTFRKLNMNWTASINGKWIAADTGLTKIRSQVMTEDAVDMLQFKFLGNNYFTGNGIAEKLDLKGAYNGVVEQSISFKGTGELVYV